MNKLFFFFPLSNKFPTIFFFLKKIKDQRLRQRYYWGFTFDLLDYSSRDEWCGISWTHNMWSCGGYAARSGQDHHTSLFHCRPMLVWLDCSKDAWRPLYLLCRVRILRRWYPKPFASRLRQFDNRPHQDGDTDGNVLVFHLFCMPDRPSVGRCSDSKGWGQFLVCTNFRWLFIHGWLTAIGSCYHEY